MGERKIPMFTANNLQTIGYNRVIKRIVFTAPSTEPIAISIYLFEICPIKSYDTPEILIVRHFPTELAGMGRQVRGVLGIGVIGLALYQHIDIMEDIIIGI
jgi:hypothetical protein